MKTYEFFRDEVGEPTVYVDGEPLPLYTEVANHSPCGFEWGYAGSGPHQLSLALLIDLTGCKETAKRVHGKFTRKVIAKETEDNFLWTERHLLSLYRETIKLERRKI